MHLSHVSIIPVVLTLLSACAPAVEEDEENFPPGYEDIILEGAVTDETVFALAGGMDAGAPVSSAENAATLDSPSDAAELPKSTIPTFSWHVGATTLHSSTSQDWLGSFSGVTAGVHHAPWPGAVSLNAPAAAPQANPAHGAPYSGYGSYLVFSTSTDATLVQVFTSNLAYTPTQEVWDQMAAAGENITVTLVGAVFDADRISSDGGPFAGSSTEFKVTP